MFCPLVTASGGSIYSRNPEKQRNKLPYQIHGIISSDSDSDTDTKEEFDELYYSLKPPPIELRNDKRQNS
ncbi:hypothetical protein NQ318_000917 [Aromia moschata]|uniref:Uncharacterized protein n=1 Tax=Aromia moschata TaxID=1265417 RepID=A0AAV8ZGN3_9CUCU|nr:hypothetical protein NQ318_000917 [Aromia moschata]